MHGVGAMRSVLPLLLVLPAAACGGTTTVTQDQPRLIASKGDRVLVAASIETETQGLGCGGGGDPRFGPSVLFVSETAGAAYERVVPEDARPLSRISVRDGVFYAIAQDDAGFAVVTSRDGRSWTQVATGQGEPHDLAVSDAGILVAHSTGVLASTDGVTWVDHAMTEGLYAPSVALVGHQIAVGTAADGVLRLSSDATAWTTHTISRLQSIWELIPAGDAVLVTGMADIGHGSEAVIGRLDLANAGATPTFRGAYTVHAVMTPAGLLDTSGYLAPIEAGGVGALAPHVAPFESASVDGTRVQLLRNGAVSTSLDGGHTFGAAVALPRVRIEE
jgi:hypothetical protein